MRFRFAAAAVVLSLLMCLSQGVSAAERWFEDVKKNASPEQLYTFLYALPKGGDLHNHLEGSILSEWLWEAALARCELVPPDGASYRSLVPLGVLKAPPVAAALKSAPVLQRWMCSSVSKLMSRSVASRSIA